MLNVIKGNIKFKTFCIYLIVIFILSGFKNSYSNNLSDRFTDSLNNKIKLAEDDTLKIVLLLEIADYLKEKQPDKSLKYIVSAENILQRISSDSKYNMKWFYKWFYKQYSSNHQRRITKIESSILRLRGEILTEKKLYDSALVFFNRALVKSTEINDVKGCNFTMLEIGKLYLASGNYQKALANFDFVMNIAQYSEYEECIYLGFTNLGKLYEANKLSDSSIQYYSKALESAKKIGNKYEIIKSEINLGNAFQSNGNLANAVDRYRQVVALSNELGVGEEEAYALFKIGQIYAQQGRSAEAIEVLLRATRVLEKIENKSLLSECYLLLGIIYSEKENSDNSLVYILKSLEINQLRNDNQGMATAYLQLGNIYTQLNRTDEAFNSYFKGIDYQKKLEDHSGLVKSYIGLGELYQKIGDHKLSNFYYQKALAKIKTIEDLSLISKIHIGYSKLLLKVGDVDKAKIQTNLALINAQKTKDLPLLLNAIDLIAESYEKNGQYKEAFLHLMQGYKLLDSISKKSKYELVTSVEASYITELKQHELETLNKAKEVQALKIKEKDAIVKKQRILNYFYLAGFIFLFAFGYLFFRQAQRKKAINEILEKQNEEISSQRDEIEAQRDEIEAQRNDIARQKEEIEKLFQLQTDSILYARQIQNAILPDTYVFEDNIPNSFVYYRPKDIVSGDFYWVSPIGGKIGFTVVDCTGHGVAGAMLSMLASSLLNELTSKPEDIDPGNLLTELRSYIIMSLWQRGFIGEQVVGMDLAFCLLDPSTLELKYSGSNNPVFILSKTDDGEITLVDLKPDKMPISMSIKMNSFTTQSYQLKKGDVIYLFSDGFSDQIGGPRDKKYSLRNFRIFLSTIVDLPMNEQERLLAEEFEKWKGKNPQIDDVTIMGIKV